MTVLLEEEMTNSINAIGQRGKEYQLDRENIVMVEEYNIRRDYGDIEGEDLASIQEQGIKQALIGFMFDGKFYGCDGFRRMRKYDSLLSKGLIQPQKIPCKLDQRCETQEGRILLALEMSSGKQLNMCEQGQGFIYLRDNSNYTLEKIAQSVGKSKQHVCDCLALVEKAPEAIQEMIQSSSISPTEALRVFREEGDNASEVLKDAVNLAESEGKTKATAKHVKKAKESKTLSDSAVEPTVESDDPIYSDDIEKQELAGFLATCSDADFMALDLALLKKLIKKLTK